MSRVAAALVTLWLVWGSTYLAIRLLVEHAPPFVGAGLRFALAGAVLLVVARLRGRPRARGWVTAAKAGVLLVPLGNALVCVASQYVPSGLVALLMATVPAQLVLFAWAFGGARPTRSAVVGLVLGFVGVGVLAGAQFDGPLWAVGLVVVAASGWSLGSIFLRSSELPEDPSQALGMAVLVGGLGSIGVGFLLGERLEPWPMRTVGAFAYLVVMGSLVAGTVYTWLVRNAPARLAGSYAFMNPVVAVALGFAVLGEPVGGRMLIGAAIILAGVVLLLKGKRAGARVPGSAARDGSLLAGGAVEDLGSASCRDRTASLRRLDRCDGPRGVRRGAR